MHELHRTVRFFINPRRPGDPRAGAGLGYAGVPSPVGLARFYEMRVTCSGAPDPTIGYLVDIKAIDRAVRTVAVQMIERACQEEPTADPAPLLASILPALDAALPVDLAAISWQLSPYHGVAMTRDQPTRVILRQRFDFAAAHRLHVPSLSDAENRELFGKCNNHNGHGHNYQFEPAVEIDLADDKAMSLGELEALARDVLLEPFDHTHLNEDTEAFGPGGVNPTVENIARVFYDLLAEAVADASPHAQLRSMTVWETDRTCATFPADPTFGC